MAPGKAADASAWAIDIANHAASVTGNAVTFGVRQFGEGGAVGWITGYADAAAVDASQAALANDAGYGERIAGAAGLFIEGSPTQILSQRLN